MPYVGGHQLRGTIYATEAEEVLMIVDVICAAGHRFSGPSEMLEGTNEMGCWEERIA